MYPFISCLFVLLSVHDSFDFRAQASVDVFSTVVPHDYSTCIMQRIVIQRYTANRYVGDIVVLLSDICHVVGRKMATAVF